MNNFLLLQRVPIVYGSVGWAKAAEAVLFQHNFASAFAHPQMITIDRTQLYLPAVPVRSDRRLRPARPESAAVPAPAIKSGAAVPEGRTAGARPPPLDDFGRLVARQKAVIVPGPVGGS